MLHRILLNYLTIRRERNRSRRDLKQFQNKMLRRIVGHAYYNVPYYNAAYKQRQITPDQITSTEKLPLLPILTRGLVEANYPDGMLAQGSLTAATIIRRTTGTTGRALEIVWDSEYCDMMAASKLLLAQAMGTSLFDRTVEVLYAGPLETERTNQNKRSRLRRLLVGPTTTPRLLTFRSKKVAFRKSILEIEEQLRDYHPAAINSRPAYLRRLGVNLKECGRSLQFDKILAGGEVLSTSVRRDLEAFFDSEVFDALGSQELGALGVECREHNGIHLFSDCYAFEFIKDGETASAGEAADLVVTSLYNRAMPLIRYKLGDVVVPERDEECACGLSLPKLREISGRPDDGLQLPGGTQVPVGPVVDRIEEMGFRDYQVLQTGEQAVTVKLVEKQIGDEWTRRLLLYLRSVLGEDVQIKVEQWKEDDIPPKYRPVLRQFSAD